MIDKTTFWIVMPALAIGTYAIRFSFLGTLGTRAVHKEFVVNSPAEGGEKKK